MLGLRPQTTGDNWRLWIPWLIPLRLLDHLHFSQQNQSALRISSHPVHTQGRAIVCKATLPFRTLRNCRCLQSFNPWACVFRLTTASNTWFAVCFTNSVVPSWNFGLKGKGKFSCVALSQLWHSLSPESAAEPSAKSHPESVARTVGNHKQK